MSRGLYNQYFRYTILDAENKTSDGAEVDVAGSEASVIQVSGTFSGTVTFKASVDGTNFDTVQVTSLADGQGATTTTAAGVFRIDTRGLSHIRADVTAYTSGAITVTAVVVGGK